MKGERYEYYQSLRSIDGDSSLGFLESIESLFYCMIISIVSKIFTENFRISIVLESFSD